MDAPQGLTLATMALILMAVVLAFIANAFGGWIGLGIIGLVYGLISLAGVLGATAILVGARPRHPTVHAGVVGTRATLGLTGLIGVFLVVFAAFADVPVAWRIIAATVAFVDGIAVLMGLKALGGKQVATVGR